MLIIFLISQLKNLEKFSQKLAISELFSEICLFFNIPIFITHYIVSQLRSQGSIRGALFLTQNAQSPKSCPISHVLTLFRIGFFRAAQGWGREGGGQKGPLPKICHKYPTMMKFGTVIPYLKKI